MPIDIDKAIEAIEGEMIYLEGQYYGGGWKERNRKSRLLILSRAFHWFENRRRRGPVGVRPNLLL